MYWAHECEVNTETAYLAVFIITGGVVYTAFMIYRRHREICLLMKRMEVVEGDLEARLDDGSVRLLKTEWLLEQDPGYVIQRRQQLPSDAFWPPADAVSKLHAGRVAALSYKWLGPGAPDNEAAFHTRAVRRFLSQPAIRRRPFTPLPLSGRGPVEALVWDWASLYQENGGPDDAEDEAVPKEERCHKRDTPEHYQMFQRSLKVMGNVYASPRVLVIQQRELPDDGALRIPYERSGWCQFEANVSALVTVLGGHAVELGGGRVRVQAGVRPKSAAEMARFFRSEQAVTFQGAADRELVASMYDALRKVVDKFDAQQNKCVAMQQRADRLLTHPEGSTMRRLSVFWIGGCVVLGLAAIILTAAGHAPFSNGAAGTTASLLAIFSVEFILIYAFVYCLPSSILRTHLAAAFTPQSLDAAARGKELPHTCHLSWWNKPPFRLRRGEYTSVRASHAEPISVVIAHSGRL
jgi:hypothetical protein